MTHFEMIEIRQFVTGTVYDAAYFAKSSSHIFRRNREEEVGRLLFGIRCHACSLTGREFSDAPASNVGFTGLICLMETIARCVQLGLVLSDRKTQHG